MFDFSTHRCFLLPIFKALELLQDENYNALRVLLDSKVGTIYINAYISYKYLRIPDIDGLIVFK